MFLIMKFNKFSIMKKLFLLSKQNLDLSKEEVLQLFNIKNYKLIDNLLITKKVNQKLFFRLAYTKFIYEYLFEGSNRDILKKIKKFRWNSIYKKNFCVRFHGSAKFKQVEFSDIIWNKINNPKVELAVPETAIEFFFIKDKIIAAKLVYENKEKFEERKPHLRPELSPISLHPRLARCLINLTGIEKGPILDPFCGVGGILIEAGLMKLKPIGYDIDNVTLQKCKINLTSFNIKAKLYNRNALTINQKVQYIVTDLPYGKNSKMSKNLYENFLKVLRKILRKRAVVVFPNKIDKRLIKKNKLKIVKEFEYYIHKSLTKKILVVE